MTKLKIQRPAAGQTPGPRGHVAVSTAQHARDRAVELMADRALEEAFPGGMSDADKADYEEGKAQANSMARLLRDHPKPPAHILLLTYATLESKKGKVCGFIDALQLALSARR